MRASRSSQFSRAVRVCLWFLLGLIGGRLSPDFCHGLGDTLGDNYIIEIENGFGQLGAHRDSTVLEALYLEKECSNELWECQEPGALTDVSDPRCFSICIAAETGCRSCCRDNTCYKLPGKERSLGTCGPCPHQEDIEKTPPSPGQPLSPGPTENPDVPLAAPPGTLIGQKPPDALHGHLPNSPNPQLVPSLPPNPTYGAPSSFGPPEVIWPFHPPPEPPPPLLTLPPPQYPSSGIVEFPPACPPVPLPSYNHGQMCGDGPGTATFIDFDGPEVNCMADGSPLCREPIFSGKCTAYNGTIGIWFGTYIHEVPAPVMNGHLSRLGLSGITHILEDLLIMLPAGAGDTPTLVLSLFEDLTYIGGTLTVDVNTNDTSNPRISRQFALSSLHKVSHIGGNLNVHNTRLKDLSMFGALTCVGRALGFEKSSATACSTSDCHTNGQVTLAGNGELVSYNGLQFLTSVTRSVSDVDGGALMNISALAQLAQCADGAQPKTRVKISVAACPGVTLKTWSNVCTFISSTRCPSKPPAPSPPLMRPPGPLPAPPFHPPASPPPSPVLPPPAFLPPPHLEPPLPVIPPFPGPPRIPAPFSRPPTGPPPPPLLREPTPPFPWPPTAAAPSPPILKPPPSPALPTPPIPRPPPVPPPLLRSPPFPRSPLMPLAPNPPTPRPPIIPVLPPPPALGPPDVSPRLPPPMMSSPPIFRPPPMPASGRPPPVAGPPNPRPPPVPVLLSSPVPMPPPVPVPPTSRAPPIPAPPTPPMRRPPPPPVLPTPENPKPPPPPQLLSPPFPRPPPVLRSPIPRPPPRPVLAPPPNPRPPPGPLLPSPPFPLPPPRQPVQPAPIPRQPAVSPPVSPTLPMSPVRNPPIPRPPPVPPPPPTPPVPSPPIPLRPPLSRPPPSPVASPPIPIPPPVRPPPPVPAIPSPPIPESPPPPILVPPLVFPPPPVPVTLSPPPATPPPQPPPMSVCPLPESSPSASEACTAPGDEDAIEIWELLGPSGGETPNKCRWRWGFPTSPTRPPTQECTSLAFGRDCSRTTGEVNIRFAMADSWSVDSTDSSMGNFLQTLGIGNVTEMEDLIIENVGVNINAPINLNILTKLKRANVVTIIGYGQETPVASLKFIIGLPGLKELEQVNGLNVIRTSVPNLQSFSGLKCVGGMRFDNNVVLRTLKGIENVRVAEALRVEDSNLQLIGQVELKGVDSLTPLKGMASCDGELPVGTLVIDQTCPDVINSWAELCGVLENLDCRVRPPPPPLDPLPPPDAPPPPDFPPPPDNPEGP